MKIKFDITGDKELMRKLDSLPNNMEKKVIRTAVRTTQKVMVPVAKANAQSMVGGNMGNLLAKAIIVRAQKKQKKGSYSVFVLLNKKYNDEFIHYRRGSHTKINFTKGKISKEVGRTYIPAAIEYGHMVGPTLVPAIPFIREAAGATANERMRVFKEQLRIGLLREAIKAR